MPNKIGNTYLKYRYGKEEATENQVVYADVLNTLFEFKRDFNDLKNVLQFVKEMEFLGVFKINETSQAIVEFIDGKPTPRIKDLIQLEAFMNVKSTLIESLRVSDLSIKDKSNLLYFFRYSFTDELTEEEINEILEQRSQMVFTETDEEVKESFYNAKFPHLNKVLQNTDTLLNSFGSFERGKNVYVNQHGNKFAKILVLNCPLYIPLMQRSLYVIGNQKFLQSMEYTNFIEGKGISLLPAIKQIRDYLISLSKYPFSNWSTVVSNVQQKIFSLFFEKQVISPTKEDHYNDGLDMSWSQYKKDFTYEFKFLKNITQGTVNEQRSELFKIHFKEYNVKLNGKTIFERWGESGYDRMLQFPLHELDTELFDPTFTSATAKFLFTYRDAERTPMALELNPFAVYNRKSIRNSLGSYTILKSLPLAKIDKQLTYTHVSEVFSEIPSSNLWFLNDEYTSSEGFGVEEGLRLIDYEVSKEYGIFFGMKLASKDLNKGVANIMPKNERIFFIHNNKRIYLSVMSPRDMMKRENFGGWLESLYNGKKVLNNQLEPEFRDINKNPLKKDELLELQEVFVEINGETKSLGMKSVSLWTMHYVHETDTNFDEDEAITKTKYVLGVEATQRMFLEGGIELSDQFIRTDSKRMEITDKIIESTKETHKLYGKHSKVVDLYKYKGLGFNSTVVGNSLLAHDQTMLYLVESDVDKFKHLLKAFLRDPQKYKEYVYKLDNRIPFDIDSAIVRNPSIDAGNFIPGSTRVIVTNDDRFNVSILVVNPDAWARQGGDFDGDQGYVLFIKDISKLKEVYSLAYIGIKESTVYSNRSYSDFNEFITDFAGRKKTKAPSNLLKPLTIEQVVENCRLDPIVVHIGKSAVGVAKTVTMKILAYVWAWMRDNYFVPSVAKQLIVNANQINEILVQKTIDIAKWADNIEKVKETVYMCYKMVEVVETIINNRMSNEDLVLRDWVDSGLMPSLDNERTLLQVIDTIHPNGYWYRRILEELKKELKK